MYFSFLIFFLVYVVTVSIFIMRMYETFKATKVLESIRIYLPANSTMFINLPLGLNFVPILNSYENFGYRE